MLRGIILLLFVGFSSAVEDISLPVGSNFTVSCIGVPDVDLLFATYTWTFLPKDNQDISSKYETLDWDEPKLTLSPVEFRHAGHYTCVAKGQSIDGLIKLKRNFKLTVQDVPVQDKVLVVAVDENDVVMIPCRPFLETYTNTSYANAIWSKGDSKPEGLTPAETTSNVEDNEKVASRITWFAGPADSDWTILIDKAKPMDTDLYRCEVTVGSEKYTVIAEVVVEPAPPPRCLNHTQPWEPCPDPDSRSWRAIVSESLTAFSSHLYSKLRTTQGTQNLLISPISVASLLSHLLLGARGETRDELEKALSLPKDFSCLHMVMKMLRDETKEKLLIANQMFYNPKYGLREAFVNQSLEFYDMVPGMLTNSSEENVMMVNNWVEEKTKRKITKLVDSVEPTVDFILLNAVYFIGKWLKPFEENTKQSQFMTLSGDVVNVPSLYSSKFSLATTYMSNLKAQVAKFPLTGDSSLYILVPNTVSEKALTTLEDNLNENNLRAMVREMTGFRQEMCEVTLPKTKLSISTDLGSLLKRIGLSGLFNSPNLCALFAEEEEPVDLTDSRHQAYFSLTEQGVEAAAASSISLSRSFNTFSAMQPFVFIIWNDQTACPLFMGRLTDPREVVGEKKREKNREKGRGVLD
ncbi:plasma protease C1 inhibitor-like [Astyanax mexicanus]|uniref:Plasma protease C1 inhibitor-like n=1 Tax=Astyanax mexicanus TaxID=7994 RepID=A0A8B9RKT1_ASTMX|nr:plasma protease C1 inhibitor-like [Astyanax mexicanus]